MSEEKIYNFTPAGVCCKNIEVTLHGETIQEVKFIGGCPGNLSAIAELVKGKERQEIINMFEGHKCGNKPTSCIDQFVTLLKQSLN